MTKKLQLSYFKVKKSLIDAHFSHQVLLKRKFSFQTKPNTHLAKPNTGFIEIKHLYVWHCPVRLCQECQSWMADTFYSALPNSCLAGHEFEPSAAEHPPCGMGRCTLHMSRLKRPPFGKMWKLEEREVLAQVSSLSLGHGSKLRGLPPIALEQLCSATLTTLSHSFSA
ncbi:hypothetical protein TNCV_4155141 [Trichonephila clavipes]|nr:hypothetical protein TNCV_4155141 [Trichonephila clavipes]